MKLWFNAEGDKSPSEGQQDDNTIVLSEAFYREIDQHRIPVEREVVAALAHAPGVLDFYVWLVWKSWTLNGNSARIPLFDGNGLAAQLGCEEYSMDRFFRRKINGWLRHVKALWPGCTAVVSEDGCFLVVSSCRTASAIKPASWQPEDPTFTVLATKSNRPSSRKGSDHPTE